MQVSSWIAARLAVLVEFAVFLISSTIYDQGEPFVEGFAFFVAPSWGDTMTSRKEAGAFRGGDTASRDGERVPPA